MKRLIVTILIAICISLPGFAQPERPGLARIHAFKMAYITDRLQLTPRQAGDFIPIYNDYEREIRDTRQYFFQKYRGANPGDADDATSRQFIDDNLDYQQKVLDIRRKYKDQFLKVISPQQVAELNKAEREFKQILIKKYEKQRGHPRFMNRRNGY
jgi:hypothetical protein